MNLVRIAAVGDLCPGDHYFSLGHGAGSLDDLGRHRALHTVQPVLSAADIALCNLEGVLSPTTQIEDPVEGSVFRGPCDWAQSIRAAGFTAVNVANNHSMQHGIEAFWNTVHACRAAGLDVVGLSGQDGLPQPIRRTFHGIDVALLGASCVPDPRVGPERPYASPTVGELSEQVQQLTADGARVIVSLHAGIEDQRTPDASVLQAADALAMAGASIVLVHHSHIFQPVLRSNNALIATGLGNFFFDLLWHHALTTSAVLSTELSPEGPGDFRLTPFKITRSLVLTRLRSHEEHSFRRLLANSASGSDSRLDAGTGALRCMPIRKALYFLTRLQFGNTRLKLSFLASKVSRLLT